jgi:hypothetical protein
MLLTTVPLFFHLHSFNPLTTDCEGDKQAATLACKELQDAINELADDPLANMRDAASRLASAMRDLFSATKGVLANPHDKNAREAFDRVRFPSQSPPTSIDRVSAALPLSRR